MVVGSFLVQYFMMSFVMANKVSQITNNLGKLYVSIMMGLVMGILEVIMHDVTYNTLSIKLYVILGLSTMICIYLYKTQLFIDDIQYLDGMVEHHSMALLTSNKILEKSNNYEVVALAKNIIQTQKDEIVKMGEIKHKLK
jgi:hypothetical protein